MTQRGEERYSSKLTEADVLEIRRLYAGGAQLRDLAKMFAQVSKPNLHHIIHRRRWAYLAEKGS